jgi:ribulose-bisphosphate carboxylase large chain
MIERNIKAEYLIETALPLQKVAEILAGEQSSGTFVKLPGETAELKEKFRAEVEQIRKVEEIDLPSLPGALKPDENPAKYKRAYIKIAWPFDNIGVDLLALMAAVAGNIYEMGPLSGIKLMDIEIPSEYHIRYKGPKYGINGTRKFTGVYNRPIIGTIIKPSVGLTPRQTADQVKILIEAGLDFMKDDELMADPPHSPFHARVENVMRIINDYADRTGKKPMYAFNISGTADEMKNRHDLVVEHGGSCVMVNVNWVGLTGIMELSKYNNVPIHGHRNFWGALTRHPLLGLEFTPYQKILSLAGIDHLHTNGIRNKFCESDLSVIRSILACLDPKNGGYPLMPVISSGQWAEQALDTFEAINSFNVMYLCGGGITAHPGGMDAGVRSILIAWKEAVNGKSIYDIAGDYPEIQQAIDFYGKNI